MCGFPLMHIDKYLKVLVQQNKRFVALCEEFPTQSSSNFNLKQFDRRVSRVVTPGTLIDESFLNQYENNFLMAVNYYNSPSVDEKTPLGLAWIDVSTGEFFSKVTDMKTLRDDVTRIGPREVILPLFLENAESNPILQALKEDESFIVFSSLDEPPVMETTTSSSSTDDMPAISDEMTPTELPISLAYTTEESSAIALLTSYMQSTLLDHMPTLTLPNKELNSQRMQIDSHTIKALEIRENIREGGTKGSLLSVVKRTVTSSGTRLLSRWLCMCICFIANCHISLLFNRFTEHLTIRDQRQTITGSIPISAASFPFGFGCSASESRGCQSYRAAIPVRSRRSC